jgi:ABC-type nitrate/sulfonate/bicarbonate transport system substrate-binding protein
MRSRPIRRTILGTLLLILAACTGTPGADRTDETTGLPELSITVFAAPSQSIWLPTLIQELELDKKQGFHLRVNPKPGPIAYTDFATGSDKVCYCSAPSAVARFVEQGSDITLLWNIFNLDYFVVTNDPDIRALKDLAGKRVGADTGTGSWAIAAWLLQQNGLALDKVELRSSSNYTATITELSVGRLDAMAAGLINVATLATSDTGKQYRILDLNQQSIWRRYESSPGIPSIAFGVWRPWLESGDNRELVKKLYRANLEAAAYIRSHPEHAARLISARTSMSEAALLYLFKNNPDMIDIRPISEYKGAIRLLTQKLLPAAGLLERPLTDAELDGYVSDFKP